VGPLNGNDDTGGAGGGTPRDDDVLRWDGIDALSARLRRGDVTATELAVAALGALDAHARPLNAVVVLADELARAQAAAADEQLRAGASGPLCGIPYGIKDMFATRELPTSWGSAAHAGQCLDTDAAVVEDLSAASAVLAAKLSLVALAGAGSYSSAAASSSGPGRNPWSHDHWAGGSSSGSAAAVAAGTVPFALGSDTCGSTVIPAAFCGITGLRPSYGRISRSGMMPVAPTMDTVGILARSARDCGLVLDVLAGRDERDSSTAELEWLARPAHACRIGVLPCDFRGVATTADVFATALDELAALGLTPRPVALPRRALRATYEALVEFECATVHRKFIGDDALERLDDATQRDALRACLARTAAGYVSAAEERSAIAYEVRALFEASDVLVSPTVMTEAPALHDDLEQWRDIAQYDILGALVGLPGLSIPMGFGPNGLPLGLALIGDVGAEPTLLALGAAFQQVTDWHERRPLPSTRASA
jgi:aspartyl-tRNA(Asn)/glutamyl-tRNA(Gln) amidotransferase subunit A